MTSLLVPLPGNEEVARDLAEALGIAIAPIIARKFPDGETYLRFEKPLATSSIALVCTLDRPDDKFLRLLFAAAVARELGATKVGLVAPYLAYMRQDRRFHPGEAVTSTYFAKLLSANVDWLVTVDPHLHRHSSLGEIYSIPTHVVHAAPLMSDWIRHSVQDPLLIGPDSESEQWVSEIAREANVPYIVLQKIRRGDRDVEVSVPDVDRWRDRLPILVDDIISTGRTMAHTIGRLREAGMRPPICLAVHGLFAANAYAELLGAGAAGVVTTNTVAHSSNGIDVTKLLSNGIQGAFAKDRPVENVVSAPTSPAQKKSNSPPEL